MKNNNQQNEQLIKYYKRKRLSYFVLGIITLTVWLIILVGKIVISVKAHESFGDIVLSITNNIFDNILGILPPILLFDFGLNYLQQEQIFDVITEQITNTIMTKNDILKSFDEQSRRRFLESTVDAILQDDREDEVALNAIKPYLNRCYDIRPRFDYDISLRGINAKDAFDEFPSETYMFANENLEYEIAYVVNQPITNCVHIGFFLDNKELNNALSTNKTSDFDTEEGLEGVKPTMNYLYNPSFSDADEMAVEKKYVIREALRIHNDAWQALSNKNLEYFEALFMPQVIIDDVVWKFTGFALEDKQLDLCFKTDTPQIKTEGEIYKIYVAFRMPQLNTDTLFQVSIVQPTYSPTIKLEYDQSEYEVNMFPFFSSMPDTDPGAILPDRLGQYNVHIHNNWVYPMSGVLFEIDKK